LGFVPPKGSSVALTEVDRKLLRRCLADEPGSWKDFVDRFSGLFVHVIRHTAHSRSVPLTPEDEDDLLAEIFLKLLENNAQILRKFRQKSSLAWYLTVVTRRIAVHEITRRRKAEALGHSNVHHATMAQVRSAGGQARSPQHRIDDEEEIRQMLEDLPPTDAAVVRQYHLEGRSYREISAILGIPENSIGPTLSRARERLRAKKVQS
jgi:RNA polymerase sigma-70 factor, ECF subfamily